MGKRGVDDGLVDFKALRVGPQARKYITLFIIALLTPYNFAVNLGPLVITCSRLFAFFAIYQAYGWLSRKSSHLTNLRLFDGLALFHCFWVVFTLLYHHGISRALESGGIYFLEFYSMYAFGRYVGMLPERISLLTSMLFKAALILAPLAYIESVFGVNIVKELLKAAGFKVNLEVADPRFGLDRASATLPHPILYGLFASSALGLSCFTLKGGKVKRIILTFFATFPALSSAPLLSVTIQSALIAWNYIFRLNSRRWYILLALGGAAYIIIELLSNRDAITVLMSYLTFNAQTGYWRKLIWEFGMAEVFRHPWMGLGFNDWQRPTFMWSSSVDTFWLLTAMRHGLPGFFSLAAIIILTARNMLKKDYGELQDFRMGWFVSMIGMIFVGITVHFWANSFVLFAVLLGMGVSISGYRIPTLITSYSQMK